MNEKIKQIQELENQISNLTREYLDETPPCQNKKCVWHRANDYSPKSGNCGWTNLLETCREYKPEVEE